MNTRSSRLNPRPADNKWIRKAATRFLPLLEQADNPSD